MRENKDTEVNRGKSKPEHLVSMPFQLRFARRPSCRADNGFVLPDLRCMCREVQT